MKIFTEMLPHQAQAFEKLKRLTIGALYMEMGTGKTRTALELIKTRLDAGKVDRVIWLCPCSVKGNLLNDIKKHSDLAELPGILTICGIETLSSSVKSCSELMSLVETYSAYLIVDESSLVKNHAALRSIHITQLAENCKYKLILNGTPVTKFEADLYSQWYILDKRILGYKSFWSFARNHLEYDERHPERIVRSLNVDYLAQKIAPYTYQCLKKDVFQLPSKTVNTKFFYLTEEQNDEYDTCIEMLLTDLDEMSSVAIYRLFGALQGVTSGYAIRIDDDLSVTRYPLFPDPEENPRMKRLKEIIPWQNNDKVLIFCTYTDEIKDVEKVLNKHKPGSAVTFYGEIPQKKRQEQIDHFRNDAQFLVANKSCGAYGLNLQFCHNIIYYSHDWDWGTRTQSEDRVHRYGQTEEVSIVEIAAYDSIDIQILRCLAKKENLSDRFKGEISKKSVEDFVRGKGNGKGISKQKCV